MKNTLSLLAFVFSLPLAFAMENEGGVKVYTWEDYFAFFLGLVLVGIGIAIIREYLQGEDASQR
jgi:hypothetical protein